MKIGICWKFGQNLWLWRSDGALNLQIKAPRSKPPAFISWLKKRIKLKCRRMPPCAVAPAKSDPRCCFNVLTQTLEGSFSSSRYFAEKIRGSAVNGTEPTGGMKSRNSPLQNNPTIGLVQPSHPCEAHPVICPPPTLRHGSCLRSNPGFFSD